MNRDQGRVARLAWDLSYVLLGATIAVGLAWPIYRSPRMLLVAAVGVVLGFGVILLARRLKWPAWIVVLAALGAYLLVVVPVAIPSALTSPMRFVRGLGDGVVGVVAGWKQLLTLTLPVGEYQAVLVPLLVVMLVGTLVATALVIDGRWFAAAAVPVVLLMGVFGLVFGASDTGRPLVIGAVVIPAPREVLLGASVVLLSLVWLVGRARLARARALRIVKARTEGVRQGGESLWPAVRRQALAIILVGLAIVGGIAVAPVAAGWSPRQALRDAVDPLVIVQQQPSPLSGYRAYFEGDLHDEVLFRVDGADGGGIDRVRIATLGLYDGEVFRAGSREGDELFTRLPRSGGDGVPVTITIGDGYSGVWVPVPGAIDSAPDFSGPRADELADGFYVSGTDAAAVDVAVRADGGYGLASGDSYTVSALPGVGAAALAGARGGEPLISSDDHEALADWVEAQQVPRSGEGVVELVTRLRDRGYLSHSLADSDAARSWITRLKSSSSYVFQSSYSGHSIARVESLFADLNDQERLAGDAPAAEALVSAVGDDEQFATAAALLARYLGFDSRVVVGARLVSDEPAPSVSPCESGVCTGSTVTAWVEVLSPGIGWATLDASPQYAIVPTDVAEGEELPENPTIPRESRSDVVDPPPAQRDESEASSLDAPPAPGWFERMLPILLAVGSGIAILFFLLLPLVFLLVVKRLRRRRRRDVFVPEVSAVGAWDELIDTYVDYDIQIPVAATRLGVAQALGRPAATELAVAVDTAVFAEHPPTREVSERAWRLLDDERTSLARGTPFFGRIKAAVNLDSFFRHFTPRTVVAAGLSLFTPKETAP